MFVTRQSNEIKTRTFFHQAEAPEKHIPGAFLFETRISIPLNNPIIPFLRTSIKHKNTINKINIPNTRKKSVYTLTSTRFTLSLQKGD